MLNGKYALVCDGFVADVASTPFAVSPAFMWVPCPAYVSVGWTYDGTSFIDPPELVPSVEDTRMAMLETLAGLFGEAAQSAHLISSVGFEIDANEVANRNIEGLVLVMSDTDTTMFCDYNNQFHEVTKAQLEIMRKEIVEHSLRLYQTKWQYRSLIEAATTVEELDAIKLEFE